MDVEVAGRCFNRLSGHQCKIRVSVMLLPTGLSQNESSDSVLVYVLREILILHIH